MPQVQLCLRVLGLQLGLGCFVFVERHFARGSASASISGLRAAIELVSVKKKKVDLHDLLQKCLESGSHTGAESAECFSQVKDLLQ